LSTLLRISLVLLLVACTEEQSRAIGQQPKKTVDRVTSDVNKAMRQGQGSERLKEKDE
jgi:hypothetical protein